MQWIVLAGSRPGVDPIAEMAGEPYKALVKVAGVPMLERVTRTLLSLKDCRRVTILLQDDHILTARREWQWLFDTPRIQVLKSNGSACEALLDVLADNEDWPVMVTTADNVMLTPAIAREFITGVERADTNFAFATVAEEDVRRSVPETRRTYWHFADGGFATCNLFAFNGQEAMAALRLWRQVEQDRKRVAKVVKIFGLTTLIGFRLGLITLAGGLRRASKRLGLSVAAIPLDDPRACIDVDKPEDFVLTERLLALSANG